MGLYRYIPQASGCCHSSRNRAHRDERDAICRHRRLTDTTDSTISRRDQTVLNEATIFRFGVNARASDSANVRRPGPSDCGRRKRKRPFRPMTRGDARGSLNLLRQTSHLAKTMALAQGRLHKADAIIADRKDGAGVAVCQTYAD